MKLISGGYGCKYGGFYGRLIRKKQQSPNICTLCARMWKARGKTFPGFFVRATICLHAELMFSRNDGVTD